ncbi:hypothetical protein GJW-30_1_03461 [Variibacter gotjawalensis]|uniref:Thioesterase superfamily protein n=1 Tax=Variibacter gotjawalensis TaxID=1333996 RepID=A0A0S3PYA2_9BRAD|nr:thioesterase family protein [Variibacter gotjawalensis]NIK46747.1 acyl-CoA thioesterase [Variibacter gotjawalensis]RZS48651.1 thioesterase superfamily protein [Variibacter gotjawalensis]BAT60911.1 hypothetical protein GJW-30_1_03461 [Variibacter gotjawalensis]
MVHILDEATVLTRSGDVFSGRTHPYYWNFTGPFGGFTGGALMRAVLEREHIGDPVAMTVNYCSPLVEGDFEIAIKSPRTNKSSQHFSLELSQGDAGIAATATAVTAIRRESWDHAPKQSPDGGQPEDFKDVVFPKAAMAWLSRYRFRLADGELNFGRTPRAENASARSVMWMADNPARPVDFISLMAMSDAFLARIAQVRGAMVKLGTVSMTTYFHVSAEELAANGDAFVLGMADATVFHRGFHDQISEIWSRAGVLLATSHQIVYYRD